MRVLVVSPAFHGYWRAIVGALEVLGHDVSAHCYDSGDRCVRFANAMSHRLPPIRSAFEAHATEAAIDALHRVRPDAVFVVRGDALGSAWWDACARAGVHVAVWLYDELHRMRYTAPTLASAHVVFSYSLADVATLKADGVTAAFLPDGYDSLLAFTSRPTPAVTLIGARYAPRERTLAALATENIPIAAYGREWSRHPWDVARTGRWRPSRFPAHRDLERPDYYGVMAGSLATLNVHGEGHDGLSMRTYEAPGVGGLQLIDRPAVAQFYDVGTEVLVFADDAELVEHARRALRDRAWADSVRRAGRARTLAHHTLVHRMREVERTWG